MFVASDLSNGPEKSIFGRRRAILIKRLGIVVKIEAADAEVQMLAKNDYEFTKLCMGISVENLNTQSGSTETRLF
jgi:hypothetical protein